MQSTNRNQWIVAAVAVAVICFFLLYHFVGGMRGASTDESQSTMTDTEQNAGTSGANPAQSATPIETASSSAAAGSSTPTGPKAVSGSTITVNYTLKLASGEVADTSVGRGPFSFTLGAGQVIAGWDKGLLGAQAGQHLHLIVPPEDGYGSVQGHPLQKETLYFDIDVISVK